jgi:arginase
MNKLVSLIGAPTDIGASARGASMGPQALRVAGLGEALQTHAVDVIDRGNLVGPANPWLPPVNGADFNTNVLTPSGNIHGMPVACLCGHGPEPLVGIGATVPALNPKSLRQIGIRSVDAGEKRFVHEVGLEVFDMRYIDEMGMRHTMELALATLDDKSHLHVSFDVDFLDPEIAPGVGTTVAGGPTYREAQLCMEMIADTGRLASLDVMELNPALDVRNKTAALAVDLIESLFGKSTLMRA